MTPEIARRLAILRRTIAEQPTWLVAGHLSPPAEPPTASEWAHYGEFLAVADGARLGEIDLWSAEELLASRGSARGMRVETDGWLAVGQLLYQPLGLRRDGCLFLFSEPEAPTGLGTLDDLLGLATSDRYADLFPGARDSPWLDVLRAAGLA